jgi:hypothetical protein
MSTGHGTGTNLCYSPTEECKALPDKHSVFTVIETPVYSRKAEALLSDSETEYFVLFISTNPSVGSVVRGSGGFDLVLAKVVACG